MSISYKISRQDDRNGFLVIFLFLMFESIPKQDGCSGFRLYEVTTGVLNFEFKMRDSLSEF